MRMDCFCQLRVFSYWFLLACFTLCVLLMGVEMAEYCSFENFNATCPENHVVIIDSALYGRITSGRCLKENYLLGCKKDVKDILDGRCSGRRSCEFQIPDKALDNTKPCRSDLKFYLEAEYSCMPVTGSSPGMCHYNEAKILDQRSANIASVVTEETGAGAYNCPWKIRVGEGQRINLTLLDFGAWKYDTNYPICERYATIKMAGATLTQTICGGEESKRHVMTTDSNEIELGIIPRKDKDTPAFIFQYEAIGCATPGSPMYGWTKRNGNEAVQGCNASDHEWTMVCQGNQWVGQAENCTQIVTGSASGNSAFGSDASSIPYGLLVSVAIGVILGIMLGATMLVAVLTCKRNKRRGFHPPSEQHFKEEDITLYGRPMSPERMYAPPYGKTLPSSKDSDRGAYQHIWELRQGPYPHYVTSTKAGISSDRAPYASRSAPDDRVIRTINPRNPDHVYESPLLERRDDDAVHHVPYYHEFDPTMSLEPANHLTNCEHITVAPDENLPATN